MGHGCLDMGGWGWSWLARRVATLLERSNASFPEFGTQTVLTLSSQALAGLAISTQYWTTALGPEAALLSRLGVPIDFVPRLLFPVANPPVLRDHLGRLGGSKWLKAAACIELHFASRLY